MKTTWSWDSLAIQLRARGYMLTPVDLVGANLCDLVDGQYRLGSLDSIADRLAVLDAEMRLEDPYLEDPYATSFVVDGLQYRTDYDPDHWEDHTGEWCAPLDRSEPEPPINVDYAEWYGV